MCLTSRYRRLDSFDFGKVIPLMKQKCKEQIEASMSWTDGSSIGVVLYTGYALDYILPATGRAVEAARAI